MGYLIKFVVAFALPPIITIILSFLLRQQAIWQELILFIGWMLSLLVLFFREFSGRTLTQLDVMVYLFGTFAGISALRLWLDQETSWLETTAVTSIFSDRFRLPRDVHLRQLLNVAVLLERDGATFYRKLAQGNIPSRVKELCQKFANEEETHQAILQNLSSHWIPLRRDAGQVFDLYSKVKEGRMFGNPPYSITSEQQLIAFAIEQENKLLDFYISFEKAFPEQWNRIKLEQIVMMGQAHVRELSDIRNVS
jgi:rubrerythrin